MRNFVPDYTNVVEAAWNRAAKRVPLYEHIIVDAFMEKAMNKRFADLAAGDSKDKREYFRNYIEFFLRMGYDTISFERCIGQVMPGSGALGGHKPGAIKNREDFERYPWESIPQRFFNQFSLDFEILRESLPEGMKAIGGPGYGVFEIAEDIVGYMDLCYLSADDPELYEELFQKIGDMMVQIWAEFLQRFGDMYAVCRFGDDLGFKSTTLISAKDIKTKVIPQYKRLIEIVHSHHKPFLLHSCGNIFSVMDEMIDVARINAKHSNEDVIAPFSVWIEKYGDRIGNFGGVDVDVLCQRDEKEIKEYVQNVVQYSQGRGGIALGSGNSIPDYVPVEGYMAMIETVREMRGE